MPTSMAPAPDVLTPAGTPAAPPPQAGVSAREAEVLVGIAAHLTNAQIAARLFISVRTVESHVSSLLRKLGAGDRRALARLAAAEAAAGGAFPPLAAGDVQPRAAPRPGAPPTPLTPFVGRAAERAALAAALAGHRLVTAVGLGGIGKTRLALAVAGDLAGRFADGVWYADLVPVTDGAMVAPALAGALGLGEQHGRPAEETVAGWLGDREALLVLDNCEHLVDGVVVLVERLLAACPRVRVLATSRARLLVPYERVFLVPGMTVTPNGGDAVELFLDRVAATGGTAATADRHRVAEICRGLDGVALAIELAAARLPVLGLDGLEAGLDDRLRLLAGGRRLDDRHRSLRSALDWSYALLTGDERAILRRVSVFATSFTPQAAAVLLDDWPAAGAPAAGGPAAPGSAADGPAAPGWPVNGPAAGDSAAHGPAAGGSAAGAPAAAGQAAFGLAAIPLGAVAAEAAAGLARLAEHNLLTAVTGPDGTRYRVLETIRQYGAERLAQAGELAEAHDRHLRWCLAEAGTLEEPAVSDRAQGRAAFDQLAGELRAALDWAAAAPGQRDGGYRLAIRLAELCFARGLPGEAQLRYEQAATLAADQQAAASALDDAASAAEIRHFGGDAMRLHRACAAASVKAGDRPRAAYHLAQAAELVNRGPGLIPDPVPPGEAERLIEEASALADGDPAAQARVLIAEGYTGSRLDPVSAELADRGLALAQRARDPVGECAALDLLTSIQLSRGDMQAAAASALRRTKLLAPLRRRPLDCGVELFDSYQMAAETAVAAGDLAAARELAEHVRDLPFYREEGHLATPRLLVVTALAGDWDETAAIGERFRAGWERAGRPRAGNLSRGPYAAAAVCGLRGDEAGRAEWLTVVEALVTPGRPNSDIHHGEFFDALVLLHQGRAREAVALLAAPPEDFRAWYNGLWRPWYAALWAEAAVLAGDPAATGRISRARQSAAGNPVALAIVARCAASVSGDREGMLAAAERLRAAGCRYQWARTLILAGGPEQARGEDELAAMGATPMAAG